MFFVIIVFPAISEPHSIGALKVFGRFAKRSTRNVKTGLGPSKYICSLPLSSAENC